MNFQSIKSLQIFHVLYHLWFLSLSLLTSEYVDYWDWDRKLGAWYKLQSIKSLQIYHVSCHSGCNKDLNNIWAKILKATVVGFRECRSGQETWSLTWIFKASWLCKYSCFISLRMQLGFDRILVMVLELIHF